MNKPSTIQMLASVKQVIGTPVQLKPYERLLDVWVAPEKCTIRVETFRYHETSREITFTHKGTKLIEWRKVGTDWSRDELTLWEAEYKPETIVLFGRSNSPTEHKARVDFEHDCYRPGSSHSPMDNFDRTIAGASTVAMQRYWFPESTSASVNYKTETNQH